MAASRRDALILGGVGAAAAAIGALAGVLAVQSRSGAAALLAARFTDLEGRPRRLLDEWRGRALLCNFWATWCAPCLEEVPMFVGAQQQFTTYRADLVGIAIDSASKVGEFALKFKINYPVFIGGATALALLGRLSNRSGALPYTVVLDRSGAVVARHLGALNEAQLRQVLASLGN